MDNFEQIQQNWLGQPINQQVIANQLDNEWRNRQLKVLTVNVFLTLSFLVAFVIIGCIYYKYHNQYGWLFSQSIIAIYLILTMFLVTTWKSLGFKQQGGDMPVTGFIDYQLRKYDWQRRVLSIYVWIYVLLLWVALCGFILTFTDKGLLQTWSIILTTFYILGISWASRRYNKKRLISIDDSIQELNTIRSGF